jgi:hypothetical protein
MDDRTPNSGQAPWLYNRNGFTPFDNMGPRLTRPAV